MKTVAFCLLLSSLVLPTAVPAADTSVVIGGSELISPPRFWLNSFVVALSGSQQAAHPFHVISGNDWLPTRLEIPLYHYNGMAGNSAMFSICADASGKPGAPLATFPVSNITTEQRVLSIAPSYAAGPLHGDCTYWLVGSNTGAGQVNWNMQASTGDFTRAIRSNGGNWIVQNHLANTSAFAIKGTAVPEPSSFVLLALGVMTSLVVLGKNRRMKISQSEPAKSLLCIEAPAN